MRKRSSVFLSVGAAVVALVVCLPGVSARAASGPMESFQEAGARYEQGDFAAARDKYGHAEALGGHSANLFFNIGNSEYRLGAPGRAILAYERALFLAPAHPESRANLTLVRNQAGAKELPAWIGDPVLLALSTTTYTVLASLCFWTVVLTTTALLLWRRTPRIFLLLVIVGGFGAIYSGLALWRREEQRAVAIVLAPEAVARLEAADRAGVAESLPAGSEVRLLSEHGAWVYCELPSGGRGWLAQDAVERIAALPPKS